MQRMTRQRLAIAEVLQDTDEFRSAQQLHEILRSQGSTIGLATVYRTLQSMAEAEQVDVLRTADGENLYRSCADDEHHHHLVCRTCGATQEIDVPVVEEWATKIADSHGYSDIEHVIEIFGICRDCRARSDSGPAARVGARK